ncbi:MAG: hypothetical protein K1Y36_30165 [Blastocatellia bacterium]|nr:hypothetical protein [Blastocatellia bacterium]
MLSQTGVIAWFDPGGIVYTPRVSDFIVEATLDFLACKLRGPAVRRIFEMGIWPPARALAIVARKSTGETAFTAQLTQVCISPETKRPVVIPEELRSALSS